MSMNDEQFEHAIGHFIPEIQEQMRARDTAQREALARVEAERDTARQQVLDVVERSSDDIAHLRQQLAEAVGLLGTVAAHYVSIEKPEFAVRLNDFLARHAQAEQQEASHGHVTPRADGVVMKCGGPGLCAVCTTEQEAQGAQAGEWKYCPECGSNEISHSEGVHKQCANCGQEWFSDIDYSDVVQKHLSGHYLDKDAVIATLRAALATQPAAGEPFSQIVKTDCRTEEGITVGIVDAIITLARVMKGRNQTEGVSAALDDLRQDEDVARFFVPPAAAHGDDGRTCRFCQKRFDSAGECGNHVDQFHHGEAELAAMCAQGDGEVK